MSVFWLFVGGKVYICLQVPTHSFMNSLSSSVKFHNLMLPSADEESRFFSKGWVVICQIASSWAGQFSMQKLLLSVGPCSQSHQREDIPAFYYAFRSCCKNYIILWFFLLIICNCEQWSCMLPKRKIRINVGLSILIL